MGINASTAKHIVEHLPINILTCDAKSFVITYANHKSIETLNSIAHLLPEGVSGENIVGQCIDVFHKNPSHQRNLLADSSNLPHRAVIRLGDHFLELNIFDVPGGLSGNNLVLSWTVVTEAERLKRMCDKMPINIMMCEPKNFTINYINETSRKTLKTIEHLLPIKVDDILGSSIDVFHKHPEHQRNMLRDPNNLPHRAKIKLGDETLELNVAAIIDDSGNYIGPMVSWQVITEQVKVAENVRDIAETVATASSNLFQNSDEMADVVNNANTQSSQAATASAETMSNVQSVAAAAEELVSSIQEISQNMSKSQTAVQTVVSDADRADDSAHSLGRAAEEMSNIVVLIQDIAGQINLLALNATIESARAGDAGKGFAVVASEVKNLASQTTKATEEIAREIDNMQQVSKDVITGLSSIKTSVNDVNNYVSGVASAIEEQTAVTSEISSTMQHASVGVDRVNDNVNHISNATKTANESTKQVQDAAQTLSDQAQKLNKEMEVLLD